MNGLAHLKRRFRAWRRGRSHDRSETPDGVLDHYVAAFPTPQNAIDAIPGWNHAFPDGTGVVAGRAAHYFDDRVVWALALYGSIEGREILELGPLEGMHTYMLDRHNPARIDAVEANTLAYLRCLVTKELLDIKKAKFYLGDFMQWMEKVDKKYDLIVACGVLYHASNPIRLLELLNRRSDSIFIWTHYFDNATMPVGDPRRVPFTEEVEVAHCRGVDIYLHVRSYHRAYRDPAFCGGLQDRHFWMRRSDVLDLLKAFGYDRIEIAHDAPHHVNGPSFSVFAQRTGGGPSDAPTAKG